jgi:hypothetical protein
MDTNAFTGEMQYIDTVNTGGWIVFINQLNIGASTNPIVFQQSVVWVDMSIPYLYLPTKYWNLFAVEV